MNDPVQTFSVHEDAIEMQLHSRVYTAQAHPNYEDAPGWFFLFQCIEAVFYLCDRHGFRPEQVVYCGVIGKGIRQHHMWTAMEWCA